MGGLDVWILRGDMTLKKKSMASDESHIHHGDGCYLNIMGSGLKDPEGKTPPVLLFQEGNTVPKGAQRSGDDLMEKVFTVPDLKATAKASRGGSGINWGKYFNLKTLPFILIGIAVLAYFATGGK